MSSARKAVSIDVAIKRVYEAASPEDGERVLVDRIWPRGIAKEAAAVAEWMKEVGPSTELRKWFGHEPARWPEFQRRYRAELAEHDELIDALLERARAGRLTLVYSAKDEARNQAVVIADFLRACAAGRGKGRAKSSPRAHR